MNLSELNKEISASYRRKLAEQVGITDAYLYMLATHARSHPRLGLLVRLAEADKRLSLRALIKEFGHEPKEPQA